MTVANPADLGLMQSEGNGGGRGTALQRLLGRVLVEEGRQGSLGHWPLPHKGRCGAPKGRLEPCP